MNNIRKKRFAKNFIFSLYYLLESLSFEPAYLWSSYLILTETRFLRGLLLMFLIFGNLKDFKDIDDYEFELQINK